MTKPKEIAGLEADLGYRFNRSELLEQALTHSSYARELESQQSENAQRVSDNEQLEFLGDSILGFVTSQELFQRYPGFREGQLSKLRAHLVSEKHLIRAAKQLHLGRYLRLGRGEDKSGGRSKPALLVDALEAVLAAMCIDAGLDKTRTFILKAILEPELCLLNKELSDGLPITDYKSALQEAAHVAARPQPSYVLVKEEGPEHMKKFTVEARIHSQNHDRVEFVGRGKGATKKMAEQDAAHQAIDYLWSVGSNEPRTRTKSKSSTGK